MATSLLQVRVEDSLKDEAAQVFERLGIDTSTAVRMFLKRAMMEIGNASEKNGVSDMSLDEINAEIEASRKERQGAHRG